MSTAPGLGPMSCLRDLCASCNWVETITELRGTVSFEVYACFYDRHEFPAARNCPEFSPADETEDED